MAKPEKYYLPYNFVPVTGTVNDKPVETVEWDKGAPFEDAEGFEIPDAVQHIRQDVLREDRLTGYIDCQLEIISPTFIGAEQKASGEKQSTLENYKYKNALAIPGNSLRGMLSSIAERISQSSLRVLDEKSWPFFKAESQSDEPPLSLAPFNDERSQLTPAELIFGAVSLKPQNNTASDGHRAFASRVCFFDAELTNKDENGLANKIHMQSLGSPRLFNGQQEIDANHIEDVPSTYFSKARYDYTQPFFPDEYTVLKLDIRNFYQSDAEEIPDWIPNGSKFYLQHERENQNWLYPNKVPTRGTSVVFNPIKPKTKFKFTVRFTNLTEAELGLLQKSLTPSVDFQHQIGMGKNLGMGKVKITAEHVSLQNLQEKYTSFSSQKEIEYKDLDTTLVDKASLELLVTLNTEMPTKIKWREGHLPDDYGDMAAPPLPLPPVMNNFIPYLFNEDGIREELYQDYLAQQEAIEEKRFFELFAILMDEEVPSQPLDMPQFKGLFSEILRTNLQEEAEEMIAILREEKRKDVSIFFGKKSFKALKDEEKFKNATGYSASEVQTLKLFES